MQSVSRLFAYVPASGMFVFSILLIQLPLFNYLGYEFSAACALLLPFIIGPVTIAGYRELVRQQRILPGESPAPQNNASLFRSVLKQTLRSGVILLAIPCIVATVNIFIVKNCSYGEGLLFFLLIPGITLLWSISLGLLCASLFRKALLVYFVCLTIVLLHPLYPGYFSPSIYSYNVVYGFFPGFSYDEILTITPTLLLFRGVTIGCTLLFGLCSLLVVSRHQRAHQTIVPARFKQESSSFENHDIPNGYQTMDAPDEPLKDKILSVIRSFRFNLSYSFALLLFLSLSATWFFRFDLGFETSEESIQKELSATHRTEHFIIHYAPSSFSAEEIEYVGQEHEFRLSQDIMALNLVFKEKITSYIYPDVETKRTFIGAGATNIAKPWRKEIHMNKDSWEGVVKHELVHVLAGEFGMPIIKAHYNIGLTEGLATAIDNDWGNRTLHQYAAAMKKFGIVSHPERLVSAEGFMMQASGVSYVLMGSFCKFLIDTRGIEQFKLLYGGEGVQTVYHKPYDELVNDWQSAIDTITVPDSWQTHIEYFFKRQSIFAKECARTIARLNREGYRLLAANEIQSAKQLFSVSLRGSANTDAFAGLVRSHYLDNQHDSVVALMKTELNDSSRQGRIANLMLLFGNSLWTLGDTHSARTVFTQLLEIDLSDRYNEAAMLRLQILHDTFLVKPMAKLFTDRMSDSAALQYIDSLLQYSTNPILLYSKARIEFRLERYTEVINALTSIAVEFSPSIEATKNEFIGESFFQLKDYQHANQYFSNALQYTTNEASRMRIEDWIARCDWYSKR